MVIFVQNFDGKESYLNLNHPTVLRILWHHSSSTQPGTALRVFELQLGSFFSTKNFKQLPEHERMTKIEDVFPIEQLVMFELIILVFGSVKTSKNAVSSE